MTVKLVAEVGVNWVSLEMAKQMIVEAKSSGADYIKFQLFNEKTIEDSPLRQKLKSLILSESDAKELKTCAVANEIGFILTTMYPAAVDIAKRVGVDFIKIRYADHEDKELVDAAVATGNKVMISVPSKPLLATEMYHPSKIWMYCLPHYPPQLEDFTLEFATCCEGFSSHYPHTVCDLAYAINRLYDTVYIEKHVMLTKPFDVWETEGLSGKKIWQEPLDAPVSITFKKLKEFVEQIHMLDRIKRVRI
jgi:sialic acid synthase SpsE